VLIGDIPEILGAIGRSTSWWILGYRWSPAAGDKREDRFPARPVGRSRQAADSHVVASQL